MGLFNFFKPKKSEPENLELILQKATIDNAIRPLFYRTLLKSDLFILTLEGEQDITEQKKNTKNTTLSVKTLENGAVPVFTSPARILDNNIINKESGFVGINAKILFESFKEGTSFILNPYSKFSKEFIPEEIIKLLKNEFYEPNQILKVKSREIIFRGIPENYPVNLVESLKRYFDTREEIKAAYLALIHMESSYPKPYLLLGLEISNGDLVNIFGEACEIATPYLDKGEPIDMIKLTESDSISKQLKKLEYKIY